MSRKPISYSELIDIRFSDLDMYGHVNSKHYIDIVSTARLIFVAEKMKMPIEEVTKRGVGFFMTKSSVNYKRPINGLQKVLAKSHVSEIRENRTLIVPFSISTAVGDVTFADGVLEFALIDMNMKRGMEAPAWLVDLFFENGDS